MSVPATQRRYRDCFAKHIEPTFGSFKLAHITFEELLRFFQLQDFPRPTAHMARGILSSILNLAFELQRIDRNPVKLIPAQKKKRTQKRDLTAELVNKVLKAAKGTRMEGPCWAASHLGLRRGEVSALKVTDVMDDCIEIRATRDKWGEGPLKGKQEGESRRIPLPPQVVAKLRSFFADGQLYVFTDVDYKTKRVRPINPDRITKSMESLCESAGVKSIKFHDLRAASASNLKRAGIDPFTIQRILGHSTLQMTSIYMDETDVETAEAMGRLASMYDVNSDNA